VKMHALAAAAAMRAPTSTSVARARRIPGPTAPLDLRRGHATDPCSKRERFGGARSSGSIAARAAVFDGGPDGVPFFALSDADRASELRADTEAVRAAADDPRAILLPFVSGRALVVEVDPDDSRPGVRFAPAEARLKDVKAPADDDGTDEDPLAFERLSFLGFREEDGAPVFCAEVQGTCESRVRDAVARNPAVTGRIKWGTLDTATSTKDAKSVGPEMSRKDAGLVAAAASLLRWRRNTKFCQKCGSPVKIVKSGHKAQCSDSTCRAPYYPTLMPAVLTLCTCGDYALLGRNSKWPRGFYSCLAGFVDQSESLEQAVAREVLEESGVVIDPTSVRYVTSQPWPFPCQLMVGFRAEVAAKKVSVADAVCDPAVAMSTVVPDIGCEVTFPPTPTLDIAELRDARWFHKDWLRAQLGKHVDPREAGTGGTGRGVIGKEIPVGEVALPGRHALARHLVERWCEETDVSRLPGSLAATVPAVAMTDDREMPLVPTTNRSFAFRVVEMSLVGTKKEGMSGRTTVLRFALTGGGGAPTVNDHARLDTAVAAEAERYGASLRLLGGGQMCFRGGEISESAEIDDEDEASLLIVLRNGGGGDNGGAEVPRVDPELVRALVQRAYPMHDILVPGAFEGGGDGSAEAGIARRFQY